MQIRAFRRLWAVLGLSSLGDWLGLLATSTFAAQQVSGSAAKGAAFGGVIAVRMLPALILGPLAGVVADRWDRRYTMVVCDVIRFVLFTSIPTVALLTSDSKLVVGWAAVATFIIESTQMVWAPAKDSSVPNLLPRERLENANQLTLATTYGLAPIASVIVLASFTWIVEGIHSASPRSPINATHIALYFNALTFLATALTVGFGIKEISGRAIDRRAKRPSVLREFVAGWAYVAQTRLVRGLVFGIFGAFAGAGVVVGTAKFYAQSLGGGDLAFYILFGSIFVGLGIGIVAGPKIVGGLSRRRWFGLSIIWAALAVTALAFAWHLLIGVIGALCVGIGAGMAFLSGTTLLGKEVTDDVRGRVFAFIQTGTQVTLLLTISLSSFLVGLGGSRDIFGFTISTTRPLLLAAGVFGTIAGIARAETDGRQTRHSVVRGRHRVVPWPCAARIRRGTAGDRRGRPAAARHRSFHRLRGRRGRRQVDADAATRGHPARVRPRGGHHPRAGRDAGRCADPVDRARQAGRRRRRAVGATSRGAALRGRSSPPRRDRDHAGAAARCRRAERSVYRLVARISGRGPDAAAGRGGLAVPLGDRRSASQTSSCCSTSTRRSGCARAARRSHADRLEAESLAFHQRVRAGVPRSRRGRSGPLSRRGRDPTGRRHRLRRAGSDPPDAPARAGGSVAGYRFRDAAGADRRARVVGGVRQHRRRRVADRRRAGGRRRGTALQTIRCRHRRPMPCRPRFHRRRSRRLRPPRSTRR